MPYYRNFDGGTQMTDKRKNAAGSSYTDKMKQRAEKKRAKKENPTEIKGFIRAVPVILIAVALFLTLCFVTAETGAFGRFISNLLMGLFSYMAYTIPLFIAVHAIFFYNDVRERKLTARVIFSVCALVLLSMIAYIIPNISAELTFNAGEFYTNGMASVGGGFIGSVFAFALAKVIGKVGLIIFIVLAIALYILYLVSGGGSNLSRFFLKKIARIANYFAELETRNQEKKNRKNEEKLAKQRAIDEKRNAEIYNDEYFNADNGVATLEIPELGIIETKPGSAGAPFLRETVIKADESEPAPEKETTERRRRFADINLDAEPIFVRTDKQDGSDNGDIIYEEVKTPEQTVSNEAQASTNASATCTDESADAVFTESFDPFDIAVNEKLAGKLSSRAVAEGVQQRGFTEYITEMTPEQIAQQKRLEEFERNRQAAIARKAAREAELRARSEATRQSRESAASGNTAPTHAPETSMPVTDISTAPASSTAQPSATVSSDATDPSAIAERERQREQARLASILGGYDDNEKTVASNPSVSPAPEARRETVTPPTNTAENASYSRSAGDRYRFVSETAEEPRRPYSAYEPEANQPRQAAPAYTAVQEPPRTYTPAQQTLTQTPTPAGQESIHSYTPMQQTNVTYAAANSREESITIVPEAPKAPERTSVWEDITPANEPADFAGTPAARPVQEFNFSEKTSATAEFTFGEPEEEKREEFNFSAGEPDEEITADTEAEVIEISRTMLDPTVDYESADEEDEDLLDGEEDELDEDELEPEEIVERREIPEDERNPEIYAQRQMFDVFNDKNDSDDVDDTEDEDAYDAFSAEDEKSDGDLDDADDYVDDEDEPPFDDYAEQIPTPAPAPKEEKKKPVVADYSNYKFPPLELLKKSPDEDWDSINKEIQYGGEQLINTLDSFNIKATIRGMEHGPRITRYSIVPAKGVRVNQIEKLADDIALALAAESIRIEAPIPGKSAVGVEVPNKVPSLVSLRDLLEAEEFRSETSKTCVCIGKSVEGSLVYGDIGTMPHVLIAGATGMGKSVCINSLITSMLYKARPDEVKFIMIDPKKVEFAPYNGIPHLLVPVVTEPKQAAGALMWAVDEMNKRYDIIEKLCVKSIDSYNKKVAENPELGAPMSKIVIFIDELNDLMVQVRDPVENLIMLIAQKARAAGIHLVIGTQRPSVDVITGVIKANIPSRIACKVSSGIDSRTILEQTGAEKLIGKGDMLFAPSGKAPKRVQGAFVSESETESIVEFIKAQVKGAIYDEQALEDMKRAAQKCDKSKDGADDDDDDDNDGIGFFRDQKFLNAVELAIRNGSVATSFLQRKLKIGYGKAAQYIDIMEDQGIVGEKNGAKAREVKMTMQEWREMLSRRLDD